MCFGVFPKPFAADVAAQLGVQTRKKVHGRQREGAYVEAEGGDEKRTYFRSMKSLDASEGCEKLSDVLKNVFCSMAMKAVIEGELEEDSHCAHFVDELKKTATNLHFD